MMTLWIRNTLCYINIHIFIMTFFKNCQGFDIIMFALEGVWIMAAHKRHRFLLTQQLCFPACMPKCTWARYANLELLPAHSWECECVWMFDRIRSGTEKVTEVGGVKFRITILEPIHLPLHHPPVQLKKKKNTCYSRFYIYEVGFS